MIRWITISSILVYLGTGATRSVLAEEPPKPEMTANSLQVIQHINDLAQKNTITEYDSRRYKKVDAQLSPIIAALKSEAELFQTGAIAHDIATPMQAGDERFDIYFEETFWITARRLAEMRGPVAADFLQEMKRRFATDGDGREQINALIAQQHALLHSIER